MLSFAGDVCDSRTAPDWERAVEVAELALYRAVRTIEAEWRAFEKTATGHVFQTTDFVLAWLGTVGDERGVKPLIVVGRDRDGATLFVLPFGVRRCLGVRQLEWIGAEHADYHCGLYERRFLAHLAGAPGRAAALSKAVVDLVRREADVLHLGRQPTTFDGLPNPFARYKPVRHSDSSHETRLGGCWESYYRSKRDASSRRNDRSKRRNLDAVGPVRFIDAVAPEDVRRVMAALFAQKERGLDKRGVVGFFASDAVRAFYVTLALNPYPQGPTHVAAMECGGEIVAANWGLVRGDRYYYVMHSFAEGGPVARFSPGRHLMYHLMQWCIGHGIDVFDFTIGDERFKSQWCEKSVPLYDSVAALNVSGVPLALALRSGKPVKRMVKANPVLLSAVARVRRHLPASLV